MRRRTLGSHVAPYLLRRFDLSVALRARPVGYRRPERHAIVAIVAFEVAGRVTVEIRRFDLHVPGSLQIFPFCGAEVLVTPRVVELRGAHDGAGIGSIEDVRVLKDGADVVDDQKERVGELVIDSCSCKGKDRGSGTALSRTGGAKPLRAWHLRTVVDPETAVERVATIKSVGWVGFAQGSAGKEAVDGFELEYFSHDGVEFWTSLRGTLPCKAAERRACGAPVIRSN
jgi:hypothetical protein